MRLRCCASKNTSLALDMMMYFRRHAMLITFRCADVAFSLLVMPLLLPRRQLVEHYFLPISFSSEFRDIELPPSGRRFAITRFAMFTRCRLQRRCRLRCCHSIEKRRASPIQ